MRVFAYGSNMFSTRLRGRTPSAKPVGVGYVSGRVFRFNKRSSKDGSAKGNAPFVADKNAKVWGVVYDLNDAEKDDLDAAEGLGRGYHIEHVDVVLADGSTMGSDAYIADSDAVDDSLRPFSWYKDCVIRGAEEHALPDDYIKTLRTWPAVRDPGGPTPDVTGVTPSTPGDPAPHP